MRTRVKALLILNGICIAGLLGLRAPAQENTTAEIFGRDQIALISEQIVTANVRAAKFAVSGGSGTFTWTFAVPFPSGSTPVCTGTPENTAGATQPYVVNLIGAATTTGATYIMFKGVPTTLPAVLSSLFGAVINPFVTAPNAVVADLQCRVSTE